MTVSILQHMHSSYQLIFRKKKNYFPTFQNDFDQFEISIVNACAGKFIHQHFNLLTFHFSFSISLAIE